MSFCLFFWTNKPPVPSGPSGWLGQERRMRREMEEFNDLVFLPVTEGYRMNSRKAWSVVWAVLVGLKKNTNFVINRVPCERICLNELEDPCEASGKSAISR